jgi:hypothetical protein
MLAQLLAFLGSLFNLFIDTIFKIGVSLIVLFLVVIVIATAFAFGIFWLVT